MSSCPSCTEAYDSEARRPRILSCGHSLCTQCLVQLHRLNSGVVQCCRCAAEEYYADCTKVLVNLDLEARVAGLSLEEEEEQEEATAAAGETSPWDTCSLHGGPLSSWCTTCRLATCPDCGQFHGGLHHQVVHYRQAKELLLSQYEDESRAFLEWLLKVEAATRGTLEAAEAAVPPLRQTLSLLESHISRLRGHSQELEGAASLEALEDLLEKKSRWSKRGRVTAQEQMNAALGSLGRLESSIAELRRLQKELEDGLAPAANNAGPSLPTEEEREERRQEAPAAGPSPPPREEAALPASPRVLARARGPFKLSRGKERTLDLPRGVEGEREGLSRRRSTTHLEFKFDERKGWLAVGHLGGAGELIFFTAWLFGKDRVEMRSSNPATDNYSPVAEKTGCGLRVATVHQVRIVEERQQYEVFLDGVSMGCVQKAGGPSTPPAAAEILLENPSSTVTISKFSIDTE